VWTATGATNLTQLHQLVGSHVLYLNKDDVLKDLPPKTRETYEVPVSSRWKLRHQQAMQELERVYNSTSSSGSGGCHRNFNSGSSNADPVLGAVQKVRLVGSLAKVEATVKLAISILEKEPSIVVFTSFVEPCKKVHEQLATEGWRGEILTGETPPKKRQAMVDKFQSGVSPVICLTCGAGGVGLTLTAACTIILMDRPWTPGDADQAEDRVRRIGQTKPVRSIWISAFELDKHIDAQLGIKKQTATTVLVGGGKEDDDNENGNKSEQVAKVSIFQMLRTLLPRGSGSSNGGMKQTSILQFSQPASQE